MCKIRIDINSYGGDPVRFLKVLILNQSGSFSRQTITALAKRGGLDQANIDIHLDLLLATMCERGLYYYNNGTYYPSKQYALA